MPSVSDSSVSGFDFDASSCSVVENCQENVAQIDKNGLFVDDCVAHENPVIDMHHHHDSCENGSDEERREVFKVSNSSFLVLLSIVLGTVIFAVVLYTKRWFLALITLGFLLLMLLEYVGKPCFGLLKPCENVVSMSILKGALVVGVALYTKWFVVGITIGASLLILLEYAGNSACALFKPCQDVKRKLQGILPHWCFSKQRRELGVRSGRRVVLTRSLLIGSRREVRKGGDDDRFTSSDSDQDEVESEDISSRGFEPKVGSDHASNKDDERTFDDGEVISSKGEIEQGSGDSSTLVNKNSLLVEEESQNKPMYKILDHELKDSKYPKSLNLSGPVRYSDLVAEKRAIEGREKGCEDSNLSELVNHDVKCKKNKKFWKKFVPKKMHKKKMHKHEKENNAAYTPDGSQDTETDLEEDDGQEECEQEISEEEGSTTSSVEEDECGVDDLEVANTCLTEMLQLDNKLSKPCEMVKERYGNLKYLTTMMIPLTGLIGGRMFAVGLTVICCLVFKMARG
uniref:Uncharacterized protein n=1 Tax=Chenopodium quinoa TaxID=63459 RepID=A0A803LY69_CHEQI